MTAGQNQPRQDLGERTAEFGKRVRTWARQIPQNYMTQEDVKQLIRSSGSVGSNYIEANEKVSKKDCAYRLKICRKESKESGLWLRLLDLPLKDQLAAERKALMQESHELTCIFHSIIQKYYS